MLGHASLHIEILFLGLSLLACYSIHNHNQLIINVITIAFRYHVLGLLCALDILYLGLLLATVEYFANLVKLVNKLLLKLETNMHVHHLL